MDYDSVRRRHPTPASPIVSRRPAAMPVTPRSGATPTAPRQMRFVPAAAPQVTPVTPQATPASPVMAPRRWGIKQCANFAAPSRSGPCRVERRREHPTHEWSTRTRRPQAPQAPEAPAQEAAGGARLSRSARPPGLDRRRCGADRALAAPRGRRRADADPHPPRGRHRDASFGGLRGRGRLGPLLLRGRRRAPVEPRELPVELMTTTAAPLTFCPFPKFHPPSLATHSVPASKISDCSDGSKLRHLHRGSTSSTRSTPRRTP